MNEECKILKNERISQENERAKKSGRKVVETEEVTKKLSPTKSELVFTSFFKEFFTEIF
jgi:hypothetical protein